MQLFEAMNVKPRKNYWFSFDYQNQAIYQAQLILEWVSAWKHRVLLVFFSVVFLYILCIYIFDIDYSLIFNNTCFVDWFFFKCFALSIDLFYNFRNAYTNMSINKTFK